MRIGVNVVPLRVNSGGARYVFAALFEQLLRLDREHRYVVFAHPAGIALVHEMVREANKSTDAGGNVAERVRIISVLDEELIYPHRDEFDLYFNPINSLKPRILDRPTVIILHDIQEQYFPQYFSYADLISRHEGYPEFCRAATTVVTVSEFCKRSFVEKFAVDPRKIEVVHIAPQAALTVPDPTDNGSWSQAPIARPFFFYPANTYPHKNHALLLDAMAILRQASDARPHMVFVGQKMPGGYPLADEIKSRRLEETCRFFSDLSVGDMRYLYRNATAVAMPTMFEGFGMPAVEAMACGCALICSEIPALREVAGDSALYFSPGDVEGLVGCLRRILCDPALRSQLIERGYSVAARFTWQAAGLRMLDVFAEAGPRFDRGYDTVDATDRRPKIGVLLSNAGHDQATANTIKSLIGTGYKNLVVGIVGAAPVDFEGTLEIIRVPDAAHGDFEAMADFARRANLDLVGQIFAGNRVRPSGFESLAQSLAENESCGVHLGEIAVWRRDRYRGIARLRYTGDDMWRIEKLLYAEMLFLAPAALARWPAGETARDAAGTQWRWKMLLAARVDNQLAIVRRTLADCDRSTFWWIEWMTAFRAGMLDFHRLDNRPAPVPLLRRFEHRARILSQLLPQSLQHVGTKWWYRLTHPRGAAPNQE
ncbi:MAG TPA: glycosyltransferase family 1 protein [Tepidisphaeraceae bacterium]|jgi:glycosyltransferase involved in cell wall biosynthesis|nr:glycosyltransferase family 1 protein [Tepidisphaeraceae bacterium]